LIEGVIAGSDPWKGATDAEVWKQAGAELDGQPFDDVDRVRSIRWRALGVEFHLKVRNDRRGIAVAEALAAATQILVASAAHRELKLTRGAVTVDVECVPGAGFRSTRQSQSKRIWSVTIGDDWTGLKKNGPTFDEVGAAMDWLRSLSLSPSNEFQRETNELLREGLTAAVFIGRPFAELWDRWIGGTGVAESLSGLSRQALPVWTPRERPEVAWRETALVGPSTSVSALRAAIQRRYDRGTEALPQTLARLARSADFQRVARGLREQGWRDWHILAAVFHVVVNWRLRDQPPPRTRDEARAHARKMIEFRESLDDPEVPIGMMVDVSALKAMRDVFLVSMLPHADLDNRESMPDIASLEEFLRARAGLDLDVEHGDPFAPAG
jgi:hypothetical protein